MLQAFGVGEVPISISGDPARPSLLQHTIRDVGGGHPRPGRGAEPGDVLGVRGPFGTGWEVADGAGGDVVLVAGGIGLAPLRPALLEVLADRDALPRVVLLYGARTPEELLFGDELRAAGAAELDIDVAGHRRPRRRRGAAGSAWSPQLHRPGRVRPGAHARAGLRPRGDDAATSPPALRRPRACRAERIRLSMERNMKCGVGLCGHCQLREFFLCVDGPVLASTGSTPLMATREL